MSQQKMNPGVLRLLVIFPNILSYMLLFGVAVYIITNLEGLKAADALTFWVVVLLVLAPMSFYTTFKIAKKLKSGQL